MTKVKISHPFWQVLGIGILTGMRTSSAPVIASHILSHHHSKRLENSPLNFMQVKKVADTLKFLAIGELIIDKLPFTPNRIKASGLAARCLSGGLAGASIYKATGGNVVTGTVLGAASAVAATYACFILRRNAVKNKILIDPLAGVIEDALAIGAGIGLTQMA